MTVILRENALLTTTTVYALDQDDRNFDLTYAIWKGGSLTPTAAEIASSIEGEPLDSNGLVSVDFWVCNSTEIMHISNPK